MTVRELREEEKKCSRRRKEEEGVLLKGTTEMRACVNPEGL
jgi:hypothetical protein